MSDRDIKSRCPQEKDGAAPALAPDMCDASLSKGGSSKMDLPDNIARDLVTSLGNGDLNGFRDAVNRLNVELNTPENSRQFKQVIDGLAQEARKNGIEIALDRDPQDGEVTLNVSKNGSPYMIQVRSESAIDMSRGALTVTTEVSSSLRDAKTRAEEQGSSEQVFADWNPK